MQTLLCFLVFVLSAGNLKGPPRGDKPVLRNGIAVRIGLDVDMAFPVGVTVGDIFDHVSFPFLPFRLVWLPAPVWFLSRCLSRQRDFTVHLRWLN